MRRKNRVCGAYPHSLYRCFAKEEYAVQFVEQGEFRVSRLEVYKDIECSVRQDSTEGTGIYRRRGRVVSARISPSPGVETRWIEEDGLQEHHTETGNPIFAFCCSNITADLGYLKARFGRYVAKIVSPVSLAIEIDYFLNGEDGNSGPFLVDGADVEYNKGMLIDDGRSAQELCDLAYTQKPTKFSDEKEFRFCLLGLGEGHLTAKAATKYMEINLGSGRRSYARML